MLSLTIGRLFGLSFSGWCRNWEQPLQSSTPRMQEVTIKSVMVGNSGFSLKLEMLSSKKKKKSQAPS